MLPNQHQQQMMATSSRITGLLGPSEQQQQHQYMRGQSLTPRGGNSNSAAVRPVAAGVNASSGLLNSLEAQQALNNINTSTSTSSSAIPTHNHAATSSSYPVHPQQPTQQQPTGGQDINQLLRRVSLLEHHYNSVCQERDILLQQNNKSSSPQVVTSTHHQTTTVSPPYQNLQQHGGGGGGGGGSIGAVSRSVGDLERENDALRREVRELRDVHEADAARQRHESERWTLRIKQEEEATEQAVEKAIRGERDRIATIVKTRVSQMEQERDDLKQQITSLQVQLEQTQGLVEGFKGELAKEHKQMEGQKAAWQYQTEEQRQSERLVVASEKESLLKQLGEVQAKLHERTMQLHEMTAKVADTDVAAREAAAAQVTALERNNVQDAERFLEEIRGLTSKLTAQERKIAAWQHDEKPVLENEIEKCHAAIKDGERLCAQYAGQVGQMTTKIEQLTDALGAAQSWRERCETKEIPALRSQWEKDTAELKGEVKRGQARNEELEALLHEARVRHARSDEHSLETASRKEAAFRSLHSDHERVLAELTRLSEEVIPSYKQALEDKDAEIKEIEVLLRSAKERQETAEKGFSANVTRATGPLEMKISDMTDQIRSLERRLSQAEQAELAANSKLTALEQRNQYETDTLKSQVKEREEWARTQHDKVVADVTGTHEKEIALLKGHLRQLEADLQESNRKTEEVTKEKERTASQGHQSLRDLTVSKDLEIEHLRSEISRLKATAMAAAAQSDAKILNEQSRSAEALRLKAAQMAEEHDTHTRSVTGEYDRRLKDAHADLQNEKHETKRLRAYLAELEAHYNAEHGKVLQTLEEKKSALEAAQQLARTVELSAHHAREKLADALLSTTTTTTTTTNTNTSATAGGSTTTTLHLPSITTAGGGGSVSSGHNSYNSSCQISPLRGSGGGVARQQHGHGHPGTHHQEQQQHHHHNLITDYMPSRKSSNPAALAQALSSMVIAPPPPPPPPPSAVTSAAAVTSTTSAVTSPKEVTFAAAATAAGRVSSGSAAATATGGHSRSASSNSSSQHQHHSAAAAVAAAATANSKSLLNENEFQTSSSSKIGVSDSQADSTATAPAGAPPVSIQKNEIHF